MCRSGEGNICDYKDEEKLVLLQRLSLQKIDWEVKRERRQLLDQLLRLIKNWNDQLPNLRDIFKPDEIEHLLNDSINRMAYNERKQIFIDFVIRTGYKDKPKIDEDGRPLLRRTTPIHHAAWKNETSLIPDLFRIYDSFDVNYVDEEGLTHFHVACINGCDDVVKKFLELGQEPNCLAPKTCNSLLHLALKGKKKDAVELLLRYGADPSLANDEGSTPLHVVCNYKKDDDNWAKMFFDICDEIHRPVLVDVLDKQDRTPLVLALQSGNAKAAECLLRRGASPNIANAEGETPLHVLCKRGDLAKLFFKVNDEMNVTLQLDARDKLGNAPLHLALLHGRKNLIKLLLRHGADPNVVNAEGETPLHLVCKRYELYDGNTSDLFVKINGVSMPPDLHHLEYNNLSFEWKKILQSPPMKSIYDNYDNDGLAKIFFEICKEVDRPVQVLAKDNRGRTPLQLAVANLLPLVVRVLLNNGAVLSSFVFPAESDFDDHVKLYEAYKPYGSYKKTTSVLRVEVLSGALGVVQRLESEGYQTSRSDALTIMKFFAKHGLLDEIPDRVKRWYDKEKFASKARKIKISPSLSLDDLMRLPIEKAAKRFTYAQFKIARRSLDSVPENNHLAVEKRMASILLRGFYRRWGLDSFVELTRHRLPILCCEMIIEEMTNNKDLLNFCLSVAGHSSVTQKIYNYK